MFLLCPCSCLANTSAIIASTVIYFSTFFPLGIGGINFCTSGKSSKLGVGASWSSSPNLGSPLSILLEFLLLELFDIGRLCIGVANTDAELFLAKLTVFGACLSLCEGTVRTRSRAMSESSRLRMFDLVSTCRSEILVFKLMVSIWAMLFSTVFECSRGSFWSYAL